MLKETPTNRHLLRGFGPLFVGVILFVLMARPAPTLRALERDVTIEAPLKVPKDHARLTRPT